MSADVVQIADARAARDRRNLVLVALAFALLFVLTRAGDE